MQTYNEGFARAYNTRFSGFATRVAPLICDFYGSTPVGQHDKSILDLGCGTGQLALHFLGKGYRVIGIDLSEHMLMHAKENARQYVQSGQAKFLQASITDFTLDERFGLVVSTFDSLNHLEDDLALQRCFECVRPVNNGYFIFDINTRRGVGQCNSVMLDDTTEDMLVIYRGLYDGTSSRGWRKITGFVRMSNGLFERFDATAFNTVFEICRVKEMLLDAGWKNVCFARIGDLQSVVPESEVEKEARLIVVANT